MNGRVYDPRIGRFVSADPIVQAPFHSQSYNRYSYVFNSPLSYVDPSGFSCVGDTYAVLGGTFCPSEWYAWMHNLDLFQNLDWHAQNGIGAGGGGVDEPQSQPPPDAPRTPGDGARATDWSWLARVDSSQSEPGLQPGDRSLTMRAGEVLRGERVRELIGQYGNEINTAALAFGVDAGLIRGIIYEEQTHLIPGVESGVVERLGIGRTVGLGQVTEGLLGFTRAQLLDPDTNIRAIATHLSVLQGRPLMNPGAPISSLATSYNCGSCTSITSYGRRVNYYRSQLFSP